MREAPLVPEHQRTGVLAAVRHGQPEERGPASLGDEVGALELEPGGGRQVELRVSPPAPELGCGTYPLVADPEPDAVDELERLAPDAAHLAGDVPAVRIEAAVLEADRASALAGHPVPAGAGAWGGGEPRRGRGDVRSGERHPGDGQDDELPRQHPFRGSPFGAAIKPAGRPGDVRNRPRRATDGSFSRRCVTSMLADHT